MAYVFAFANQKGGVGKTTSAINIAASLGHLGKKVLLVDTDPQGNASSGVGIGKKRKMLTLHDLLFKEEVKAEDVILKTDFKNLSVLPASIDLAGAEIALSDVPKRESVLKDKLSTAIDGFDYVIIDCPPSLGLLTINALTCANGVIVPMQCEYFALEGLSQLLFSIDKIKSMYNPQLTMDGIILTMYDGRLNLSIAVAGELYKHFPKKVYKMTVPRNVRLSEAPSHGKPILYYEKYSKGALAYLEIAKEILNRAK